MENDSPLGVQNSFFNQVRKDRSRVTVLLTNGQRVSGTVKAFDKFTFLLETRSGDQIVFKHAVATVAPFEPDEKRAGREGAAAGKQGRFGNFMDIEGQKER